MARYGFLVWLAVFLPAASVRAGMIDTEGMQPWETCAMCHGLYGDSRMAKFPKLANQPYDYLVKQLQDFRASRRSNDDGKMVSNAGLLTAETLDAVARYFSRLPPPPPSGTPNALGETLFRNGKPEARVPACGTCHGLQPPDGRPYPRLEAQHAAYVTKQLRDFRKQLRTNDHEHVMQRIARRLSDAEIAAVADYVAGLPRQ